MQPVDGGTNSPRAINEICNARIASPFRGETTNRNRFPQGKIGLYNGPMSEKPAKTNRLLLVATLFACCAFAASLACSGVAAWLFQAFYEPEICFVLPVD